MPPLGVEGALKYAELLMATQLSSACSRFEEIIMPTQNPVAHVAVIYDLNPEETSPCPTSRLK